MENNYLTNTGAVNVEVKNLLAIMKQKEMRRHKTFLFTMYGNTKLYVSIREFVWTHITHPFLAEETCIKFNEALRSLESTTTIDLHIVDMCPVYPKKPIRSIERVDLTRPFTTFLKCAETEYDLPSRDATTVLKFRHPEDKSLRMVSDGHDNNNNLTLADLGFSDGSKLFLFPTKHSAYTPPTQ